MKMMTVLSLLTLTTIAQAQERKTFEQIWQDYFQKSYGQQSAALEKEANQQSLARAKRHWLPRAYAQAQWFSTNDPGQVFFNNLGQRAITQSDFAPSALNQPAREEYKYGTLGLDLPLYEGGMKSSQQNMYQSLVRASELEERAKKTEEYSELGRRYGTLLVVTKHHQQLNDLKQGVEKVISGYQVGSQSNPVGYSGLLGLKGVLNRIEGMQTELGMHQQNAHHWISQKIEANENWSINQDESLEKFVSQHLSDKSGAMYSSQMQAQEYKVKTMDDVKNMEKARFLPRVGLFAQNNIYAGARDTADSQAYGVYVAWDLFNSDSYGRVGEANAKAMAAKSKIEAYKQEEEIMRRQLAESKVTLEKNLVLLANSENLLKEQSLNAMKLFRSGMLSALQLAEVVNRRVDLIENKNKAETQYLEVYSRLYQLNN